MRLTRRHWIAAAAVAALIHLAVFIGVRAPKPGEPPGGAGPQLEVIGSAAQVFGMDGQTPDDPSPALEAETPETITPEPAGARAEQAGPERVSEVDTTRPVETVEAETAKAVPAEDAAEAQTSDAAQAQPATIIEAAPAETAVVSAADPVEAEPEGIATPMRRPTPTAEERRVRQPPRTTRRPARQRAEPRRRASGAGQGQRRSGARAASERRGAGQRRTTASPGQVRRYAGLVRARIARNRPSSRGRRGTAVVRFAISRGGGLRYVRLARSSGDRALDRAALGSVRRAAPFPRPPQGMTAGQLTFSIPFRFQ
jgi:protein TonB